jgi:hypothetical protein
MNIFSSFATGNKKKAKNRKPWKTTYSDYPGVGEVYDKDVGKFAFQHLRFRDRFDPEKVGYAVIQSENIMFKVYSTDELPKKRNWKFIRDF